jgi:hypothetical protein
LKGNRKFTENDVNDDEFMNAVVNSLNEGTDISMIPGMIDIPTCGWEEIKENWGKSTPDKNKNYPCNG